MKTAIVHDWFDKIAGSEKVVKEMLACFPDADVFSLVDFLSQQQRDELGLEKVTPSFIQRLPFARKHFRKYLAFMPMAIEQFDLSGYDLVLSSSHAFGRSVVTNAEQLHITYVHTPMRYAWDMQQQYLDQAGLRRGVKASFVRCVLHYLRTWDRGTANRPDVYIANSGFVAARIQKTYDRQAKVIYPPTDVHKLALRSQKDDFFLAAGRLVSYKRFDLVVEAFAKHPDQKLVVIGKGSELERLREIATPNVTLMGYQSDEVLRDHMQRARAFVFAAVEDFGIMPVEVQACGTPVIGLNRGGLRETVLPHRTGLLFDEQTVECLSNAIQEMLDLPRDYFGPEHIRKHAERFSADRFRTEYRRFIRACLAERGMIGAEEIPELEFDACEDLQVTERVGA
jgi:glycosyltransferase involved in cell wall biosynthesis